MTDVGDVIEGTVSEITDFGLWVTDNEGNQFLLHNSELWWDKKGQHPSEFASLGDSVAFQVIEVGTGGGPGVGSPKQAFPEQDPWHSDPTNVGDILEGTVRLVTDYGLFVEDAAGIDYLLGLHELCWEQTGDPADFASVGDKIQFKVTKIDPENRRRLGSPKQVHPKQNLGRVPDAE